MKPTKCNLCELDNGNYSMNLICCRVRFLMTQHDISNRRGWIERWEKKYGHADSATLKVEFKKQWNLKIEKDRTQDKNNPLPA